MSLVERLKAPPTDARRMRCAVGVLLSSLPDSERNALEEALQDTSIGHKYLVTVLNEEGHEMTIRPMERHRRGECKCPR